MSIALGSNSDNQIDRSGFVHGMSFVSSIYDPSDPAGIFSDDLRYPAMMKKSEQQEPEEEEEDDTSSSSSIGRNSDVSGESSAGEVDSGEAEVQSSYKGPFDSLDALEEVLPLKRGISKFYCGKSKSFTSLGDASSCSSITDIAKPENAYTRKRKNLLAFNSYFDKNRFNGLRSNSGGISKRPVNSRSTLALAVTMGSSESIENSESSNSSSSSPTRGLPPLPPHSRRSPNPPESVVSSPRHNYSPWRSFSLSDLQGAAITNTRITSSVTSKGDDLDKPC